MRFTFCLSLCLIIFFLAGCSKKVIVVKTQPAESKQQKIVRPAKSDMDKSNMHLKLGRKFYAQGKFSKARKQCEKAIEFNHRNWEAHYYLGLASQRKKDYTFAIGAFSSGLKHCPDNNIVKSEIHYAIGYSWENLGHLDHAGKEYTLALKLNPGNKDARNAKNRMKVDKTMKKWKDKRKKDPRYNG